MLRLVIALMVASCTVSAFKIGAFNIQAFGDSKMNKPEVCAIIMKILLRYDIVLIQEVRDADLSAVETMMTELNSQLSEPLYSYVVSDTLGRDTYKERYLFVYRNDKVSVHDSYHYHDHNMYTGEDAFSREPFVVTFHAPETVIKDFVLVPLHAAPKAAVQEIDALYDVYVDACQKCQSDNIIFLGDFNAGCSYVSQSDWDSIRMYTSQDFTWLIADDVDTTVGKSDCAYDRIVISGADLHNAIVPDSAKVFNFPEHYELTPEQALAVSDHYPVELELMCA
ncbi:deoxyribonuclease-1-like isoform 2-T2 [Anomaloglossus baeobatrachus]|uniref:deoxyribonuclease-1-like n=1 Tax=Anomaloglossus baeobatrachus TaxID=238106 RepID=UPI003F4F76ED